MGIRKESVTKWFLNNVAHTYCLSDKFESIKHTVLSEDHSTMDIEVSTYPTDVATVQNTSSQEQM